ncbi:MAG: hypothetical protein KAS32_12230 [Candidatus Peribacteraceae bacterium]|nr:hypothetical protein [Candidatus Peribacteraceae bacterium]
MQKQKTSFLAKIIILFILTLSFPNISLFSSDPIQKIFYSQIELKDWVENADYGRNLILREKLKYKLINCWINEKDNSKIILLYKESRSFYSAGYFIGSDVVEEFEDFYKLYKANVTNGKHILGTGLTTVKIDFKNSHENSSKLFRRGIWIFYPVPLSFKYEDHYSNFLFVILFRSDNLSNNDQSYKDFVNWSDKLTLNESLVEVVSPELVAHMKKKNKIQKTKRELIEKEEPPIKTKKPVKTNDSQITKSYFKDVSNLDYTLGKWYAPNDILAISKFNGKKVKNGSFEYDFDNNSFNIKFNDVKKIYKYKDISSLNWVCKSGLLGGKYLIIFQVTKSIDEKNKNKNKLESKNVKIKIKDIGYKGGIKFIEEYFKKIRKINKILGKDLK